MSQSAVCKILYIHILFLILLQLLLVFDLLSLKYRSTYLMISIYFQVSGLLLNACTLVCKIHSCVLHFKVINIL